MQAIETRYKGYRFRSRLEARWAVFFDAWGVTWEYEPEGFIVPGYGYYLPDFKTNIEGCERLEIKPQMPKDFGMYIKSGVSVLVGQPYADIDRKRWHPEKNIFHYQVIIFDQCSPDPLDVLVNSYVFATCEHCDKHLWVAMLHSGIGLYWDENGKEGRVYEDGGRHCFHCSTCGGDPNRNNHCYEEACSPLLKMAYAAARSARFEHGETPQ